MLIFELTHSWISNELFYSVLILCVLIISILIIQKKYEGFGTFYKNKLLGIIGLYGKFYTRLCQFKILQQFSKIILDLWESRFLQRTNYFSQTQKVIFLHKRIRNFLVKILGISCLMQILGMAKLLMLLWNKRRQISFLIIF